jgi:uncharacterized repeat protein (TIGR01451 family)
VANGGNATYADIAVTKTVNNTDPQGGATVTYTVTASALGPATSTFVTVNDVLPNGLSIVSATTSQGTYDSGTGVWNVGTLAPGTSATFVVSTLVDPRMDGQTIVNTATVSELSSLIDPNTGNNTASASISVAAAPVTPVTPIIRGGGGGGGGGGAAYDIAIDGDAPTTSTTSATLALYGTGAYEMDLSNGSSFSSSTWQPYATTLPWTLTPGAGEKTVSVLYRNVQGVVIGSAHASIDLIQGQVLGASTSTVPASCGIYLNSYIKLGANNDPTEVKKLQSFLNENLGTTLPLTGYYGSETYKAVEDFQVKYNVGVLSPWVPFGLPSDTTPTGYVYKTTKWKINMLVCPSLDLPMPQLP